MARNRDTSLKCPLRRLNCASRSGLRSRLMNLICKALLLHAQRCISRVTLAITGPEGPEPDAGSDETALQAFDVIDAIELDDADRAFDADVAYAPEIAAGGEAAL